jgi:hypothetical protein
VTAPNKIITVASDPTGNSMAAHTVNGVDVPVSLAMDVDGHVVGTRPDFLIYFPAATNAQNREIAEIFNTHATLAVRVRGLWLMPTQSSITTAIQIQVDVNRISSVGNGSAVTPRPLDTANGTIPSGVTARSGSSTGAALVHQYFPNFAWLDEISLGIQLQPFMNLLPVLGDRCVEIVLRTNQGVQIKQISAVTAGQTGALAYIVIDN